MARPERNNVDYFPFYCEDGNKMFYIEETYGNDGFSTFIKLLRELAKTNYHFLDLSKPTTIMFLSAKCKISKETLISIINDLVELGKFDKILWDENKVIWCQDFVDSIQDAYLRRNNNCITYEGLLQHLISLGIRKQSNGIKKGYNNTQSKVDYNKEEEIKEKIESDFVLFWDKYNKKQDSKKCKEKFFKLSDNDRSKIFEVLDSYILSTPDVKFRKNPLTWLNGGCWNDEIKTTTGTKQFSNPDNERIVKFNTNVNFTTRRLPESKFLAEQEAFRGGGYIYKILGYE